ncbi:NADH-quinone oxidoreductase subunit L [Bacteroidota bacterium]
MFTPATEAILIPLIPFLLFGIIGLAGRRLPEIFSAFLGIGGILASLLFSLHLSVSYFSEPVQGAFVLKEYFSFPWLSFSENLKISIGLVADPISMLMVVVICSVSLMVQWFSLTYMKGEERFQMYYAFLSLFTGSMLGLVLSSNIFQMYIFWELVGVSSFLLIGFYFQKPSAVAASKKAFIVTRFADLGFLIGILLLSYETQTMEFKGILDYFKSGNFNPEVSGIWMSHSLAAWALVLIFVGAAGKSAMFPLHIWLPDAMEGPTPVSALIHAATMVVAGVFLVGRLFPVYSLFEGVMQLVTWIGVLSSILAAIIAISQTDIKRVLAYSTLSQIGYMMFALGVAGKAGAESGFTASFFHLFTHAFFKSLLFLAAGAIIHAVHSNEVENMGGLRKQMPIVHWLFLIGCLAISGVPPFSGFFSKEEILLNAWKSQPLVYGFALIGSGLTAFYMFRLFFLVFYNKSHSDVHGHESMGLNFPMLLLAIPAVFAGFVPFSSYVTSTGLPEETHLHLMFSIAPVGIGLLGIGLAYLFYFKQNSLPEQWASKLSGLYKLSSGKFYFDELWRAVYQIGLIRALATPAAWIDKNLVDGGLRMGAEKTLRLGDRVKLIQNGKLQDYVLYFLMGILALILLTLLMIQS